MKRIIAIISLILLASCAQTQSKTKSKLKEKKEELNTCICMEIYNPVCGADGRTYENSCKARCENVRYKPGECR